MFGICCFKGSGLRIAFRLDPNLGFNFGVGAGSENRILADGDFLLKSAFKDSEDLRLDFRSNRLDCGVKSMGCGVGNLSSGIDVLGDGVDDPDEAGALVPWPKCDSGGVILEELAVLE